MRTISRFLAGFITGGILGSLLALLLTPVSGTAMRNRIQDNIVHVRTEVETAARQRSEELKQELAKLQKKV